MVKIIPEAEFDRAHEDTVSKHYQDFRDSEGIPVHTGLSIPNINEVEVGEWDRTRQRGAFINLFGMEGVDDLQIHELSPRGETSLQQHLYEEIVYVSQGNGATVIGADNEETRFEWSEHSVFYIPPNVPYRHYNLGEGSARLISQTPLPQLVTLLQDHEIIYEASSVKSIPTDYFDAEGTRVVESNGPISWEANFIPNIKRFDKMENFASLGSLKVARLLLNSCQQAHIGEIPTGMYKNAHRHGPGANITIISGQGYSFVWPEGMKERIRIDWEPWSVLTPPAHWFHQHFNTSEEPAKTFAGHCPSIGTLGWSRRQNTNEIFNPHKEYNYINYTDEDPATRSLFEEELEKKGLSTEMPDECFTDPDYEF